MDMIVLGVMIAGVGIYHSVKHADIRACCH